MRSPTMSRSSESATYSATRTLLRRSAGGRSPPITRLLVPVAAQDDLVEVVGLLEDLARPEHHRGERITRDADVEVRDLAKKLIEPAEQRATAGQEDAAIDDVSRELGRSALERFAECVHDVADRLLQRLAH